MYLPWKHINLVTINIIVTIQEQNVIRFDLRARKLLLPWWKQLNWRREIHQGGESMLDNFMSWITKYTTSQMLSQNSKVLWTNCYKWVYYQVMIIYNKIQYRFTVSFCIRVGRQFAINAQCVSIHGLTHDLLGNQRLTFHPKHFIKNVSKCRFSIFIVGLKS